ncbi:hypothetical protein FOZ60_008088 [Perkinsus olseni]|uniref:AAA+ ATPase domain-containing protein n=1 Tax=Perkinsus olseni TaxID=32597 RepID=A0A7J6NKU0_PEROL|nr:hypothetical protein FOZ60_008088 [Perkinsus olseni]
MSSSSSPHDDTQGTASSLLLSVQRTLADTFTPPVLLERDAEKANITAFLNNSNKSPRSSPTRCLYVCGCPGTGKSLTVRVAVHEWLTTTSTTKRRTTAGGAGADIININAMGLKDPTDIFTTVLRQETGLPIITLNTPTASGPYARPQTAPPAAAMQDTMRRKNKKNNTRTCYRDKKEILEQSISDIIRVIDRKRRRTIIIIDEIDALSNIKGHSYSVNNKPRRAGRSSAAAAAVVSHSGVPPTAVADDGDDLSLIRLLFEMSQQSCKLSIIGIANTVDIVRRISTYPNYSSSECKHGGSDDDDKVIIQEVVFKPYTHQQLKSILKQRLTISTQHDKEERIGRGFQDAALDLACRRVAAIHGDCRKVLDVCRHTITNRIADSNDSQDDDNNNNHEVTALDAIKVLDKCYRKDDEIDKTVECLPFQQQVVLASCLAAAAAASTGAANQDGGSLETGIDVIRAHLNRYTELHKMPSVSREAFHDYLQAIAGNGLISISLSTATKGVKRVPPPTRRRALRSRPPPPTTTTGLTMNDHSNNGSFIRFIAPFELLLHGILSYGNRQHFEEFLKPCI